MGDPRKQRKKYSPPSHPWQAERINEEKLLIKEYGLKNKKEIWKANSKLSTFKSQAKQLITRTDEQAVKEEKQFLDKLTRLNIVAASAKIEDILDLNIKDILERRLQTQAVRKGLARTTKQARQFIVHGHIQVKNKKMNIPSYLLTAEEESALTFNPKSTINDEEHPERTILKKNEIVPENKSEDKEFLEKISKGAEEKKKDTKKKEEAPKKEVKK